MSIAEALVKTRRLHLSRGHFLCQSLNNTAEACNPSTYTRILQVGIAQSLVDVGMKPWIAGCWQSPR